MGVCACARVYGSWVDICGWRLCDKGWAGIEASRGDGVATARRCCRLQVMLDHALTEADGMACLSRTSGSTSERRKEVAFETQQPRAGTRSLNFMGYASSNACSVGTHSVAVRPR